MSEPTNEILKSQKPDHVPEKFWDSEKGELRVQELLNSYLALEKKLAQNSAPTQSTSPQSEDDKQKLLKLLGVPDDAAAYQVQVKDNIFEADPVLNERLRQKGFTQDQVQEVYDLAVETFIPMMSQLVSDLQADREVERLVAHFGGADNWSKLSKDIYQFGVQNLPKDILASLTSSYEGVLALHRMMQAEQNLTKGQIPTHLASPSSAAGLLAEKDIHEMMKSPRYWRDKDPKFIAQVTQAFESMYKD
jgi:hypothetical protein